VALKKYKFKIIKEQHGDSIDGSSFSDLKMIFIKHICVKMLTITMLFKNEHE